MTIREEAHRGPLRWLDAIRATEATRAYKRQAFDCLKLRSGDTLLDVGCGSGEDVLTAARLIGARGKATGVDSDPGMVAEAWRRAEGVALAIDFAIADAADLPFADGSFTASRSDRVFQHLESPERTLAEMVRVTRRDGVVQIIDSDWESVLIDSSDCHVGREIVRYMAERAVPNGRIGRRLSGLFHAAGLSSISVVPLPWVFADLGLFEKVIGFRNHAAKACDAGLVTSDAAAAWIADLEARQTQGRFFAAGLGFIVQGRNH